MHAAAVGLPIAIIGMGCRFPGGANDPKAFWNLLMSGADALGDIPPDRWDPRRFLHPDGDRVGKTRVARGGFIDQRLDLFDPLPFGISPREAEGLDPQQRLMLEVAWEALDDAGLDRDALKGSPTGVFVGGFCVDMQLMRLNALNRELIDQHSASSATMTMLANRLSYTFDWCGPSLAVDTACSSSLVAVHLACQSLRSGECSLALAGGVNAMLMPDYFLAMSRGRFLSDHGQSRAFDAAASGYARGEGAGVVVLKPLAMARADGDPVLAVIRASGVNQDGRTAGITLPNPAAQADLIRKIYDGAGVSPAHIAYVEAHGTGTQVGDKAELETLGEVLAPGREGPPCVVGALKTRIGHLEAAAGVAGLIKTVLVLQHRCAPANLHLEEINPRIDAQHLPALKLPTSPQSLSGQGPLLAAVNAFGYGGTNAHALVEEASAAAEDPAQSSSGPWLLPISACDERALQAVAGQFAHRLQDRDVRLEDLLHSAARRRTHLAWRAAAVGGSRAELVSALEAFACADSTPAQRVVVGQAQERSSAPVFVFSGMGPQWWAMGRQLAAVQPVFRDAVHEVDELFRARAGWSFMEALGSDPATSQVSHTQVAQPANLALQVGLVRLLGYWGVRPGAVVGHSIGEVAAAWCAGALSLDDAVTVAWQRSRWQQTLAAQGGGMLAMGLGEAGARKLLGEHSSVVIAAVNGPRAVTLAGPTVALHELTRELDAFEVFNRTLQVEIAYHSPAMEAIGEPLRQGLGTLQPATPHTPWYSTALGGVTDRPADAAYWWRNVRDPVRFQDTIEQMLRDGWESFVEIGPHPVLLSSLREIQVRQRRGWACATLQRESDEAADMLVAAAALHVRGHKLNWATVGPAGRTIHLPAYPWQRQPHWSETRRSRENRLGRQASAWLQRRLGTPWPAWEVELNAQYFPWLADHVIGGQQVFPAVGYLCAGTAALEALGCTQGTALEDVRLLEMLVLRDGQARHLVTSVDGETLRFHSHAGEDDDGAWRLHATARLRRPNLGEGGAGLAEVDGLDGRSSPSAAQALDVAALYQQLDARGMTYGARMRRIVALSRHADGLEMELVASPDQAGASADPTAWAPAMLDAAVHGVFGLLEPGQDESAMVPTAIGSWCQRAPLTDVVKVSLQLRRSAPMTQGAVSDERDASPREADLEIRDQAGVLLASGWGIRFQSLPESPPRRRTAELMHVLGWQPTILFSAEAVTPGSWLVLGHTPLAQRLAALLRERGLPSQALRWSDPTHGCGPAGADWPAALGSAARLIDPTGPVRAVLCMDEAAEPLGPSAAAVAQVCHELVDTARHLSQQLSGRTVTLAVITRAAQALPNRPATNPVGAALWGAARVIANERPGLLARLLDLEHDGDERLEAELIINHLARGDVSDEIALHEGRPYQLMLMQPASTPPVVQGAQVRWDAAARLMLRPGQARGARPDWLAEEVPTTQDEVLVERWLVGEGGCGLEWSGRSTGGQVVQGIGLRPVVNRLSAPQAAWPWAVPSSPPFVLPLLQAWHCLVTQAATQPGEWVLVHSARGLMAQATAWVADRLGARVVWSPAMDASPPSEQISLPPGAVILACQGPGVDRPLLALCPRGVDVLVVIDDSGGATQAPLGNAAVGARVVKAAGAPLWPDEQTQALLSRGGCLLPWRLEALLGDEPLAQSARARAFQWLGTELAQGWCPMADGPQTAVDDVLGLTRQASHTAPRWLAPASLDTVPATPAHLTPSGLRREGTCLITGGTAGFGLELALWLARQGVRQVVLISRSGRVVAQDEPRLARVRQSGCRVLEWAVDICDEPSLERLLAEPALREIPLRGVFHCAAVLEDALLDDVTTAGLQRVLAPKVNGAMALHRATLGIALDCFVLFSSVSALLGPPGQVAYAAANACLDAMASWRRSQGLPAMSIAWGAIGNTGMAARRQGLIALLEMQGVVALHTRQALQALEQLLRDRVHGPIGVFDVDWHRWKAGRGRLPQRLLELAGGQAAAGSAVDALRARLTPLDEAERNRVLAADLCRQLAAILHIDEKQLLPAQSLAQLGLDSLTSLEWVLAVQQDWGVEVSAAELAAAFSPEQLARSLLRRVLP